MVFNECSPPEISERLSHPTLNTSGAETSAHPSIAATIPFRSSGCSRQLETRFAERHVAVCFAEMLVDFVPTVAGVSLANEPTLKKAPGGAPANVAVRIGRLGGASASVGKFPAAAIFSGEILMNGHGRFQTRSSSASVSFCRKRWLTSKSQLEMMAHARGRGRGRGRGRAGRACAAQEDESSSSSSESPTSARPPPPTPVSDKKSAAKSELDKGQRTAIITGVISVLLGVGYLVLLQLLDTRGVNLVPPPPEAFDP